MRNRTIPEAFHPGEYIKLGLDAKGWQQLDLADVMGKSATEVNEIISGKRPITPEVAKALGEIFENGAQVWLNLQASYRLSTSAEVDDKLLKRKVIYDRAPIREMQRRGWIEKSSNIDVVEAQLCRFIGIATLDETVRFPVAARKSDDYADPTDHQLIWLMRAKYLASRLVGFPAYNESRIESLLDDLSELKMEPESIASVSSLLRDYGIRFVIVEYMPRTRIDGACFWLDNSSPVVVISIRNDRIDSFWFTLIHELMHVKRGDAKDKHIIETALVGDDAQPSDQKVETEKIVDQMAREYLVDQSSLDSFVKRHGPLFSRMDIVRFARNQGVHPGIVVGQLHYTGEIPYRNFRSLLVKIKDIVTSTALTDGWGVVITD